MGNYGVFGTGVVGQTLATKLLSLGHDVMLGSRDANNDKAKSWAADAGERARTGTFRDAAEFGTVLVNATSGDGSLPAMDLAGDENLAGKVLIDVSNPLDFSHGFPPGLSVPSTDSIAERIQRAHPQAKVVKTLNTVTAPLMVDPSRVPGEHNMFVAGDDADAKATVTELLGTFGWSAERVIDLGGIVSARGLEHYVLFWVHVRIAFGTSDFNIDVKR